MFLHRLSRNVTEIIGEAITDPSYATAVASMFGSKCAYCGRALDKDRVAVEHLDGMNRFRLGLHLTGNVVVSCKRCNTEKRRDDQRPILVLAQTGWESFLSHDSTRCESSCKSCSYWASIWPDDSSRRQNMEEALSRLRVFRDRYHTANDWINQHRILLNEQVERLYRDGQVYAVTEIEKITALVTQPAPSKPSACPPPPAHNSKE